MLTETARQPTLIADLRDLGPFWNLERHRASAAGVADRRTGSPIFYGDVERGTRVELTLPETLAGLTANALLMARPDGGWDVFEDDGLLITYGADEVRVSVRRGFEPDQF